MFGERLLVQLNLNGVLLDMTKMAVERMVWYVLRKPHHAIQVFTNGDESWIEFLPDIYISYTGRISDISRSRHLTSEIAFDIKMIWPS